MKRVLWTGWVLLFFGVALLSGCAEMRVASFFRVLSSSNSSVFVDGEYMVVDLSDGTGVTTSYGVEYYSSALAVPGGVTNDTYKTTKLVLRKIPKGKFQMGGRATDYPEASNSDSELHSVKLTNDFYIGVFEVTQRQWELVMGNTPSYYTNATYCATRPVEQVSYYDIRENPANSDDTDVDWPSNRTVNANSFMGKLRLKTGLSTFDLPTEAQWEYACRAGTTTALNTGYNLTSMSYDPRMEVAGRYYFNGGSRDTQNGDTRVGTAKAGSHLPNTWGLFDMHGNVWEWCLDWGGMYPGSVSDPVGAASGDGRVLRGGCWNTFADGCRSASRSSRVVPYCRSNGTIGFRAACTLPQ